MDKQMVRSEAEQQLPDIHITKPFDLLERDAAPMHPEPDWHQLFRIGSGQPDVAQVRHKRFACLHHFVRWRVHVHGESDITAQLTEISLGVFAGCQAHANRRARWLRRFAFQQELLPIAGRRSANLREGRKELALHGWSFRPSTKRPRSHLSAGARYPYRDPCCSCPSRRSSRRSGFEL